MISMFVLHLLTKKTDLRGCCPCHPLSSQPPLPIGIGDSTGQVFGAQNDGEKKHDIYASSGHVYCAYTMLALFIWILINSFCTNGIRVIVMSFLSLLSSSSKITQYVFLPPAQLTIIDLHGFTIIELYLPLAGRW